MLQKDYFGPLCFKGLKPELDLVLYASLNFDASR